MASYNCEGETKLCPYVLLLLFLEYIYCSSGNDPWPYLCTIYLDPLVPNFFLLFFLDEQLPLFPVVQKELH